MLDFSFWNDSRFLLMLLLVLIILILLLGARRSSLLRKMFIFLTVLYNIVYLVWRAVFTLPLSFIASALTFQALAHKSRSLTWSHIYEVAMAPYLSLSALFELIFARPIRFNVTPKGIIIYKDILST